MFSNFRLIFSLFFDELSTIAGHRIIQVYSRQIPSKIEIIHN